MKMSFGNSFQQDFLAKIGVLFILARFRVTLAKRKTNRSSLVLGHFTLIQHMTLLSITYFRYLKGTEKNGFVTARKLGTKQRKFLLLQPKILLQQPNVLLTELNILLF